MCYGLSKILKNMQRCGVAANQQNYILTPCYLSPDTSLYVCSLSDYVDRHANCILAIVQDVSGPVIVYTTEC
jgi:hypothetical protein